MNDYDQAARYTAKINPMGFLRWLLPGLPSHIIFHRWLDTRTLPFPGERDRTCDTVAELIDQSTPHSAAALVVEFQSEPDPHMMDRLLEYVSRARRELRHGPQQKRKYQVNSALLNLTGPRQPSSLEMGLPGAPEVGLQFRTALRTMRDEDASPTLESIAAGTTARCILPWIPLMRGAGKRGMIELWKEVANGESNAQMRSTYAGLALVFAELAGRGKLWKQGLKGWNMGESAIINEWRTEGRAEGRAEGRTEGRAEGRAEGHAEGQQAALLRVLQRRFPSGLPADLVAAVKAQSDVGKLSNWIDAAVTVATPEEFRQVVRG